MKRLILILFLFPLLAHAQNWEWVKGADASSNCYSAFVSADSFGHVFIFGGFIGPTIVLENDTGVGTNGQNNFFVAKYDTMGNTIWVRTGYCDSTIALWSITNDLFGNVFVTGSFEGAVLSFGTTTLHNPYYCPYFFCTNNTSEVFLAKYDSSGNLLWVKGGIGSGYNNAYDVAADSHGNVYITGYFSYPSITFDTTTLNSFGSAAAGTYNTFLVKFDVNGNVAWAQGAGGTWWDYADAVTIDKSDNIYITGVYGNESMHFGTFLLYGIDTQFIFVAKYDSSGNFIWAKNPGSDGYVSSRDIAVDDNYNLYITGAYRDVTMTFGSHTLVDSTDGFIFLLKLDSSGNLHWAEGAGRAFYEDIKAIATDCLGNVYITGEFWGSTLDSFSMAFGTDTIKSIGEYDIFLTKFDSGGNVEWAKIIGGPLEDLGNDLTINNTGSLYLTGAFNSPKLGFGNDTVYNNMNANMYLAKYYLDIESKSSVLIDNANEEILKLFPNPATNKCTITYYGPMYAGANVAIYDIAGRLMNTFPLSGGSTTISVAALPPGIYQCRIDVDGKDIVSRKLVVIK